MQPVTEWRLEADTCLPLPSEEMGSAFIGEKDGLLV